MNKYLSLLFLLFLFSCKQEKKDRLIASETFESTENTYAKGFTIQKSASGITIISLNSPWPNSDETFSYALVPKEKMATIRLNKDAYDAIVSIPVERMVVTSTTHITVLETLGVINSLVGFPQTEYISSKQARKRIDAGLVKELGRNEAINTEIVIALKPEVVVGFGIDGQNKAYETLRRSNIPVVYNGDWIEDTPLGKAEWIKFFAPFFQKEVLADSIFKTIEKEYTAIKNLAKKAKTKPTVLTGGLFKDVWHVAGGKSWMAQFLNDAHTHYLWADTPEKGGIGLSLESVLDKGQNADFWLNPSMFVSYTEMKQGNRHYQQFSAFKNQTIYSNAIEKGATGGLLFYELAPQRPDLVLKDLLHIFHPELLPDHELFFFKPLD
ncbi:MAG: ABC transporter substrate-binding protein [Flavobacteriaceae bacterium]